MSGSSARSPGGGVIEVEERERPPLPSPVSGPVDEAAPAEELPTREEADALIRASSPRAPTGVRNRALVAVMYRAGLRPGEALALRPRDVDVERGRVRVPPRKGGRPRVTGLDRGTRELIAAWMRLRSARGPGPDAPLFCTLAGAPMKAAYVRELLPRLARRAGVRKRIHPLALRYAHAAELAEEGMPPDLIDHHLGIAGSPTTRRYRRARPPEESAEAVAARDWSL